VHCSGKQNLSIERFGNRKVAAAELRKVPKGGEGGMLSCFSRAVTTSKGTAEIIRSLSLQLAASNASLPCPLPCLALPNPVPSLPQVRGYTGDTSLRCDCPLKRLDARTVLKDREITFSIITVSSSFSLTTAYGGTVQYLAPITAIHRGEKTSGTLLLNAPTSQHCERALYAKERHGQAKKCA
jgi:hypothetical protein